MKKFFAGVLFGVLLGVLGTAAAAKLLGDDGYLSGWEITQDGETICSDPYVWTSIHEIECDE